MDTDSDCTDIQDAEALAEAEKLARRLPPKLLVKMLRAGVKLHERPGGGIMDVRKQDSPRGIAYHTAVHGNKAYADRCDIEKPAR